MAKRKKADRRRPTYEAVKAEADRLGHSLCGTVLADGTPAYFTMPRGSSDDEMEAEAFRVRNGRGMLDVERQLMTIARQRRPELLQAPQ
jgi:hypothetical protein